MRYRIKIVIELIQAKSLLFCNFNEYFQQKYWNLTLSGELPWLLMETFMDVNTDSITFLKRFIIYILVFVIDY
jgi:hypothetical protein